MKKKILSMFLAFVIGISALIPCVNAGTPDIAKNLPFQNAPLEGVNRITFISGGSYKYMYDAAQKQSVILYCVNFSRTIPTVGWTISRTGEYGDARLRYIIEHGYNIVNGVKYYNGEAYNSDNKITSDDLTPHEAYYVTQLAVWLWVGANNGGYSDYVDNPLANRAIKLYRDSASAVDDNTQYAFDFVVDNPKMTYDSVKKGYISQAMHSVVTNINQYNISFANAPEGTKLLNKNGEEVSNNSTLSLTDTVYLFVPEASVKDKVNGITVTASARSSKNKVYLYEYSDNSYQPLVTYLPEYETYTKTLTFNIEPKINTTCDDELSNLIKKYTDKSENNKEYVTELNNLMKKYSQINIDAGVENPTCIKPTCDEVVNHLKAKYTSLSEENKDYMNELNKLKSAYAINTDTGVENPLCKKPTCDEVVNHLLIKYPNRSANDSKYINELNTLKTRYTEINTDAGVENPSCKVPTCEDILAYLAKKYPTRNSNNKNYVEELNNYKKKYTEINTDAGVENPKCSKPTCDEVVAYLKNKYSNRTNNKDYNTELEYLKTKYVIYVDQGIENPSCSPAPGKPKCEDKLQELLNKYPNIADRTKENAQYVKDLDDLISFGKQNSFTVYTDDIQNPDCVKHYKKELIIRKIDTATGADIAGAKLQLKDENGNVIREWVTDGNPYVIENLPNGKYTVSEVEAPNGYTGDGFKEFTLEGEEYSKTIDVRNSKIPDTADLNFTLIIAAFILFLGFGVFGLIKTSKEEV